MSPPITKLPVVKNFLHFSRHKGPEILLEGVERSIFMIIINTPKTRRTPMNAIKPGPLVSSLLLLPAVLATAPAQTTFTPITTGEIVTDLGTFTRPVWGDFNDDGFLDLFVSNFGDQTNVFYLNNGNGTFAKRNAGYPVRDANNHSGSAAGDYDNDGHLDLLVCAGVVEPAAQRNALYHNNGDGTFDRVGGGDVTNQAGFFDACAWADYDNDGYLDLLVSNYKGNGLFHNNGDGTFSQIDSEPPVLDADCMSVTWVDYDNDGQLDLFLTRALFDGNLISNLLYHNNGNSNAWLEVKLVGTVANRSGIGAKVRVQATIGGKTFWQMREINNGGGWNIQPLVAHFGLGDATNIETLRIEWPSGTVQEFHNVAARIILTAMEPSRLLATISNSAVQLSLRGGRNLQYDLQTSPDLASWSHLSTLTITNLDGSAQVSDNLTPGPGHRFYRALSR
jgi:ASPIC/UnbV protein/VCBS repeat protein